MLVALGITLCILNFGQLGSKIWASPKALGLYRPGTLGMWQTQVGYEGKERDFSAVAQCCCQVGTAFLSQSTLGSTLYKNWDGGFGASCGAGWNQREGNHLMFENRSKDQ